jgi:hypothetical protein
MVFVFDITNNEVKLYINNSLVLLDSTTNVCTIISNTTNTTTIGFDGDNILGNFAFTDYRIYNRALDSAQVNALYTYVQ